MLVFHTTLSLTQELTHSRGRTAETQKNAASWLTIPHTLLALSGSSGPLAQGMVPPTVGWAFHHHLAIKKIPHKERPLGPEGVRCHGVGECQGGKMEEGRWVGEHSHRSSGREGRIGVF